jgi:hypothetical protein
MGRGQSEESFMRGARCFRMSGLSGVCMDLAGGEASDGGGCTFGIAADEMAREARLKALQGLKITWSFLL